MVARSHGRHGGEQDGEGRILLEIFFEDVYRPDQLATRGRKSTDGRQALALFEKALGRKPKLADLNRATLDALIGSMSGAGYCAKFTMRVRRTLWQLWDYAARRGWVARYESPPKARPPYVAGRSWARQTPEADSLLSYFRKHFRPALAAQQLTRDRKRHYDYAITKFHDFAGCQIKLREVSPEAIEAFGDWLIVAGIGADKARMIVGSVTRIMRTADPARFPSLGGGGKRAGLIGDEPASDPAGAAGTLLEFWQTQYMPRRMRQAPLGSLQCWYSFFRLLLRCFGREITPEELNERLLLKFAAWLTVGGRKELTVNNRIAQLRTIWRFAARRGRAAEVCEWEPLEAFRHAPDAWSIEEMQRIIETAGRWTGRPIAGIPIGEYMKALLLVGYWTALRKRALRYLRPEDVDLESGWLSPPPEAMKNKRAKRYRLGPDAIAALRAIWDPRRERIFPEFARGGRPAKQFKAIIAAVGIPRSRLMNGIFHKLRRTTVTHTAALKGIAAAIEIAGHSSQHLIDLYIDPRFLKDADATGWLPCLDQQPPIDG